MSIRFTGGPVSKQKEAREHLLEYSQELRAAIARLNARLPRPAGIEGETSWDLSALTDEASLISRFERTLDESERLRQSLVEMTRGYVWVADLDLRYTFVSPSVTDVLGYSVEEISATNSLETLTPASREAVRRLFLDDGFRMATSLRDYEPARTLTVERYHRDGSIRRHKLTGTFLRNTAGEPVGMLGLCRDVTDCQFLGRGIEGSLEELEDKLHERTLVLFRMNEELKMEIEEREQAQEALRRSEERFRTVFETAEDCIFIKDTELRYTHVNPAMLEMLETDAAHIIGKSDPELFQGEWIARIANLEARVLHGQTIETEQNLLFAARPFVFNFVRFPMKDPSGRIIGLCGIARDLTERKAAPSSVKIRSSEPGSSAMKRTLELVRRAASTDSVVLFLGASGVGKDYLAQYLHRHSGRSPGPFFTINCAALAPTLADSELFGHEAGAFTGARGRKRGLLELAEGGTLVLNEVGELSLELQAKLLTFFDTQSFTRVGGEKAIQVNTRIVAATNRDLEKDVEAGTFRRDLYYRLNVFSIQVPPLRERVEDIPLIVGELLTELSHRMGLSEVPVAEDEAMALLQSYDWPGNIRELRNTLERALILGDRKRIAPMDLGILRNTAADQYRPEGVSFSVHFRRGGSMHDALREAKRYLVMEGLERTGGNIKDAAVYLGVSRDSLVHHMKSLGIRR